MDVASCHCVNCRKMSGAAFATFVVFAPDKFEWIQGELGTYAATPDLVRAFCRDCGSPVASWRNSERDKCASVGTEKTDVGRCDRTVRNPHRARLQTRNDSK